MIKLIKYVFVLMAGFASAQSLNMSSGQVRTFEGTLDQMVPELLAENKVPGLAIAIMDDSKAIIKKGYGFADVENKTPVTSKTGFNIGSISKLFTAWGIMDLNAKHKIDIDFPVEDYLTKWSLPDSEYDKSKVTIRHILSHTAGLSVHGYSGYQPGSQMPTLVESLNGLSLDKERVFIEIEPQTQWKYSGGGYTILQLLIEEVTGKSFENYMRTTIFSPLKMKQTSFDIDTNILKRSAKAYDENGELIELERFTAQAAAGLHTNLEDMILFAKDNLNGSKILTEETKNEMRQPAALSKGRYGLGYASYPVGPDKYVTGHAGSNDGWEACILFDFSDNSAIIMLSNGSNGKRVLMSLLKKWSMWKSGQLN